MTARRLVPVVALVAGIALATTVAAQEPGSRQTREFVQAAGGSDAFEIAEAESALAESRDPQVLDFARTMIRDHGETGRSLGEATVRSGLAPPPTAVDAGHAPFLATLQSQRGADFDRVYWQHQALAHRAALVVEQDYAANGDVPSIRQAAAAAVPVIQIHLAMAERMVAETISAQTNKRWSGV